MKKHILLGITSALVATSAAFAQTSTSSFGQLPADATFGGSGIDTANATITTVTGLPSGDAFTLGLEATPQIQPVGPLPYVNGQYVATPGQSPATSKVRGTWNYDFYINLNNAADVGNYTYNLIFTGVSGSTSFDPSLVSIADKTSSANTYQDSENIAFFGLNDNAVGLDTVELQVLSAGKVVADDKITVDVIPDASSTMPLLGAALAGLALIRRKIKA